MAARARRAARRARDGGRGEARALTARRRRARRVPRVALARFAHVPDRRVLGARRRGHGGARLPGARAARRHERDDRAPGLLLRGRRPLPRHARRDAGRAGARGGALRARDGAEPAHGSRDVARAHGLRVRTVPACTPDGRPRSRHGAARRGRDARRADRHADPARPDPRRSAPRARSAPPGRALAARGRRSWASSPEGSATGRSAATLTISEHTAANHIRSILRKTGCANRTEAASYAHRHGLARSELARPAEASG